jgi:4-(gamma-glutamylamino)butanal dehydrogenase
VAALVREAQQLTVGDPADDDTVLGPLIEPSALDRVLGYIEQAKADGARIAAGGDRLRAETGGWFTAATVVDDPPRR